MTSIDGPVYACCQGSLHVGHRYDCINFRGRYETRQVKTQPDFGVSLWWTWDTRCAKWLEPRPLSGGTHLASLARSVTASHNRAYEETQHGK